MIKAVRTVHLIIVVTSLAVGLLAAGVASARKYSTALYWLRLYDAIDLVGLEAELARRFELHKAETLDAVTREARRLGLDVARVDLINLEPFTDFLNDPTWTHFHLWGSGGGFRFATLAIDPAELAGALEDVRTEGQRRYSDRPHRVVLTVDRMHHVPNPEGLGSTSVPVLCALFVGQGDKLPELRDQHEHHVGFRLTEDWSELMVLREWAPAAELIRQLESRGVAPSELDDVIKETYGLGFQEAKQYVELRAAAPKQFSLFGVQIGSTAAGWTFAALTAVLLLLLIAHLRQIDPTTARDDEEHWIGLFRDPLSRALVFISLVVLPLAANLGFALQEILFTTRKGRAWGNASLADAASLSLLVVVAVLGLYAQEEVAQLRSRRAPGTGRQARRLGRPRVSWLRLLVWAHLVAAGAGMVAAGLKLTATLSRYRLEEIEGFALFALVAVLPLAIGWLVWRSDFRYGKVVPFTALPALFGLALHDSNSAIEEALRVALYLIPVAVDVGALILLRKYGRLANAAGQPTPPQEDHG